MPPLYQGADNPFGSCAPGGIAVGLGAVDLSELLTDTMGFVRIDESMAVSPFVFLAVVPKGHKSE